MASSPPQGGVKNKNAQKPNCKRLDLAQFVDTTDNSKQLMKVANVKGLYLAQFGGLVGMRVHN